MRLLSLSLEQFRSFEKKELDLRDSLTHVFLGENGVGKTNVLESISIVSLGKSFLGADERDVVHWGDDYYRARACVVSDDGEEKTIECVSQLLPRKAKAAFINDVKISIGEVIGVVPTVTFLPQDLNLFSGSPSVRRGFLDSLLCQVSPEYVKRLSAYGKILKQRNSFLKKIAQGIVTSEGMDVWNQMLATEGAFLTVKRLELLEILQCTIAQEMAGLHEEWDTVTLQYRRKGAEREEVALQGELVALLEKNAERDRVLQSTSVGPHRDDWSLELNGRPIETFASRGQQRTAVLALLFLKVSYLELKRGEKPIVLLDDVFSELDDAHQQALLASLAEHQVLITTTHVPPELHGAKVWNMEKQLSQLVS